MSRQKIEKETPSEPLVVVSYGNKEESKALLRKYMDEESKLVKGRFRCFEYPGSTQRIQQKKYKDIPMFDKYMTDGEVYEIPLWVARWLNGIDVTAKGVDGKINSCSYPTHEWKTDRNGDPVASNTGKGPNGELNTPTPFNNTQVKKWNRRYAFESLEFTS